jgi:RimJ/RimL family protein N-acetyltransferase
VDRIDAARVYLRAMTLDDVDALFDIYFDPETLRYWSSSAMTSKDDAVRLIEEIEERTEFGELLEWGVVKRDDEALIGTCTLAGIDEQNRRAEIGFALNRKHWRQGYMREALTALLDYAFDVMKLHRMEADVDPDNEPSIRALEKLGFRREGLMRERWIVDGNVADTLFLGLLAREWFELRPG